MFADVLSFKVARTHNQEPTVDTVRQVLHGGHNVFDDEEECKWSREHIFWKILTSQNCVLLQSHINVLHQQLKRPCKVLTINILSMLVVKMTTFKNFHFVKAVPDIKQNLGWCEAESTHDQVSVALLMPCQNVPLWNRTEVVLCQKSTKSSMSRIGLSLVSLIGSPVPGSC